MVGQFRTREEGFCHMRGLAPGIGLLGGVGVEMGIGVLAFGFRFVGAVLLRWPDILFPSFLSFPSAGGWG